MSQSCLSAVKETIDSEFQNAYTEYRVLLWQNTGRHRVTLEKRNVEKEEQDCSYGED